LHFHPLKLLKENIEIIIMSYTNATLEKLNSVTNS